LQKWGRVLWLQWIQFLSVVLILAGVVEKEILVEILNELVCLSDLARVYGVGPVFARMIDDVGMKTIKATPR